MMINRKHCLWLLAICLHLFAPHNYCFQTITIGSSYLVQKSYSLGDVRISHISKGFRYQLDKMTDMALTAKRKKSNAPAKEDIYMDEELPELTNILNGLNEVKQIKTKSQSITSEESLKTPKPKVSKLKILKLKKDPVEQPKNAEISKEQNIVLTPAIKSSVEDIIRNTCDFYKTFVRMIVWTKDRIEITVSSDMIENISPESNQLSDIHSQIFATLDQRDEEFNVVQNYEV